MENITVREIIPEETGKIRELFEKVYGETFSGQVPDFCKVTEGERIYAALLDGCIAGMATVWEPDNFVHFLFVEARFRKQKVGTTLIETLYKRYGSPLTLKCLTENKNAMAFYRRSGWQEMDTGICSEGAYTLLQYCGKP